MNRRAITTVLFAALLFPGALLADQDQHITMPVDEIESRLRTQQFEILNFRDTRFEGDRTQRAILLFPLDSLRMLVQWARAPRGGGRFNNRPRYDLASYELQKMFLDESEYVVPPTVMRSFPESWYEETLDRDIASTFSDYESVLVVLQYWVWSVTHRDVFDKDRFEQDTAYARSLANTNVFSYLARHSDANVGNFLVDDTGFTGRVFAVDNGLTFGRERSDQGDDWHRLRVERIPKKTVDRLRQITLEDLQKQLGVLAQFEAQGRHLVQVEPTENLDPGDGIRNEGRVVQFGLKDNEIEDVWDRMQDLLEDIDKGDLEVF